MILEDMTAVGKAAGLHSFEQVRVRWDGGEEASGDYLLCIIMHPQAKAIMLHDELFSVDNGYLTPTFKVKRPVIKTAFMENFVRLYSELPS